MVDINRVGITGPQYRKGPMDSKSKVLGVQATQPMTQSKQFTPIRNLMIVEPLPLPTITMSGVHLGEQHAHHGTAPRAWVIAVGPDCKQVKAGDQVIIVGGTETIIVPFNGVQYRMIQETQCLGVVDETFR